MFESKIGIDSLSFESDQTDADSLDLQFLGALNNPDPNILLKLLDKIIRSEILTTRINAVDRLTLTRLDQQLNIVTALARTRLAEWGRDEDRAISDLCEVFSQILDPILLALPDLPTEEMDLGTDEITLKSK